MAGTAERRSGEVRVRPATVDDLEPLLELERVFPGDRIARSTLRRFLASSTAAVWVAEVDGRVVGDALVVYRRGFLSARLYTLAVAPEHRGRGVARALMARAEDDARERGCVTMRLEVRADNAAAIALYRSAGFEPIGATRDYYEDGSAALRMRKRYVPERAHLLRVPFYAQTLDFTCGPAALMMAMRAVGWPEPFSQAHEIALWRDANTVFMLAGHGGTSAHGLAVAARRRGIPARVWVDRPGAPFLDSVRSPAKKAVLEVVHRAFEAELGRQGDLVTIGDFGTDDVIELLRTDHVPVVLVSGARLFAQRVPHWVVVTGWDADHLYVHDPHLPEGAERSDGLHLPIAHRDFTRIARYGRARHRAMVVLGPAVATDERRRQDRSASVSGPSAR